MTGPTSHPRAIARVRSGGDAGAPVIVDVNVTNRAAFRSFVLGFLEHAEVLEPADLRAEIVDWLEQVEAGAA